MEFKLKTDYIELDNLLKIMDFAAGGCEVKQLILDGRVAVNDAIEYRIRRKLHRGDHVRFTGKEILIC